MVLFSVVCWGGGCVALLFCAWDSITFVCLLVGCWCLIVVVWWLSGSWWWVVLVCAGLVVVLATVGFAVWLCFCVILLFCLAAV